MKSLFKRYFKILIDLFAIRSSSLLVVPSLGICPLRIHVNNQSTKDSNAPASTLSSGLPLHVIPF